MYKFKPISRITKEELFEYWSITLMLDLGVFKTIMEIINHSNTKMKRNRFFLVQSTTKFTDDQIKRIAGEMSNISYDLVEGIKACTLDETIYKYILNSDSKEKYIQDNNKSPIMCIPRKPHENGLLSYIVGTFLERIHHLSSPKKSPESSPKRGSFKEFKYPYIIEFLNKLDNEINPSSSVDHVLGTYKDFKFHLVGDSAFFSKDNLNHIVNKGWLATISDSSSSNINTLLKDTLKNDKSWIAIELDGYYKVCKIDERDEKFPTFKSIATTGFKTQNREVNPSKGYNISDAVDLYKLNVSTLKKCLDLGVSRSSSNRRMVISICGILSHSTNPNSYSLLSEAIQKDTLKSYSLVKLKNLHQDFNLPAPAQLTCEGYILALTRLYENENFELDSLLKDLSQSLRKSPPLVSDFYKKQFNVIDIHNRYLYSGGIHEYVKNWRIFAVSCLIKSYIINISSFYMSITSKHMKFEEFKQIFIHSIREVNLVPKSPSSNQNQNQNFLFIQKSCILTIHHLFQAQSYI
ncbi:hypothetical protein DICPUDRAFT_74622 [Dictyostelium purpureum]|uniref:Uncharacterized protein n=1 Tax=Dictyostelium purpureum TaxID=5786 RepID=F0Z8A3_DICPU|nr:uncharacterized protein DICPUDRAFT_74622 [Dictyostelium purpureum]EGC39780.1 hypothetical protein DICPUDRAFT_74622 [Dictyostelium purpureum]|eukprot:XP_003283647.1 hypothetical protein DICPUDRAFT_74622 [Dictyostelium purpureum]